MDTAKLITNNEFKSLGVVKISSVFFWPWLKRSIFSSSSIQSCHLK